MNFVICVDVVVCKGIWSAAVPNRAGPRPEGTGQRCRTVVGVRAVAPETSVLNGEKRNTKARYTKAQETTYQSGVDNLCDCDK